MAVINSTAIGQATNSIGNVTFQTVKGRTIGRSKPTYVSNPQTPAQVAQRDKLAKMVLAWRSGFFLTKKLWTVVAGYGSGYNEFVKKNIGYASSLVITDGKLVTIPDGLYVSSGKYGINAITYTDPVAGESSLDFTDPQLVAEMKVGDIIASFSVTDATPWNVLYNEHVLTLAEVNEIKAGGGLAISYIPNGSRFAIAFYSPTLKTSSTARMRNAV